MMDNKPQGLASLMETYNKAVSPPDLGLAAIEAGRRIQREADAKRAQLLSQTPEAAREQIRNPQINLESYYSLCRLAFCLFDDLATQRKRIDRLTQEVIQARKKAETIPNAAVAIPNTQPTESPVPKTEETLIERGVLPFLNSILNKPLVVVILAISVGAALFVTIVGGSYLYLHKQGLV